MRLWRGVGDGASGAAAGSLEEQGDQRLALTDLAPIDHGVDLDGRERRHLDTLVLVALGLGRGERGRAEDVHRLVAEPRCRIEERDLAQSPGAVSDLLLQ